MMLSKKKLFAVLAILVFVVVAVVQRAMRDVSAPETKKAPGLTAPTVQEKSFQEKPAIKPIVIKGREFEGKPRSTDPEVWDSYSKKVFSDLKAAMSEEMAEKISQELKKRGNPEAEKNLEKLDEEIEALKKEVEQNPGDGYNSEKLIRLLEVRSKYKYLQDTFMKK